MEITKIKVNGTSYDIKDSRVSVAVPSNAVFTDTNTWRPVGTGATDAAAGNHTHGISLATDSGTSTVTLAHGTKYKLTAGGQSIIFTTPTDNNTTYGVFSSSANGLAPSTASGNITTAEGSSSVNYLCSDGKWRPLPAGAWKTGTVTSTNHTITVQSGLKSDGTTTISGTSSSAASPTVALGDSGVTAGTYKRVTVNAKGIVIGGDQTDADSDTKNTTGTTNNTGKKMFLVGAESQAANPVTYSNSNCYIGTDNCLYSGGAKVLTSHDGNTLNTAGTSNKTGTKLFLAGATSQTDGVQTFSNSNCYIGTDNCLYSGGSKVLTSYTDTNTTYAAGTGVTISGTNNAINVTYGTAANTACQGNDSRLSNSRPASDVSAWAKAANKPSYAYSEIGYTVATLSTSGSISIDGSKPLHVITLSGNASAVTLSTEPAEGHSTHVIFTSTAQRTVAIAHNATTSCCPEAKAISLTVKANGYAEVDFLKANGVIYVRGV